MKKINVNSIKDVKQHTPKTYQEFDGFYNSLVEYINNCKQFHSKMFAHNGVLYMLTQGPYGEKSPNSIKIINLYRYTPRFYRPNEYKYG